MENNKKAHLGGVIATSTSSVIVSATSGLLVGSVIGSTTGLIVGGIIAVVGTTAGIISSIGHEQKKQ